MNAGTDREHVFCRQSEHLRFYCLSLCSSLELSWWRLAASACTRACRRMLLSTLKLRPQPSNVQTKAERIDVEKSDSWEIRWRWGTLTFLSCMTVQVDLADMFRIRGTRWDDGADSAYLETTRSSESLAAIITLVL